MRLNALRQSVRLLALAAPGIALGIIGVVMLVLAATFAASPCSAQEEGQPVPVNPPPPVVPPPEPITPLPATPLPPVITPPTFTQPIPGSNPLPGIQPINPGGTIPGSTIPGGTIPGNVPGGTIPGTIPGGGIPGGTVPGSTIPGGLPGFPGGTVPGGPGGSVSGGTGTFRVTEERVLGPIGAMKERGRTLFSSSRLGRSSRSCTTCHRLADLAPVARVYPRFNPFLRDVATLEQAQNACLVRFMHGTPLPYWSRNAVALSIYLVGE